MELEPYVFIRGNPLGVVLDFGRVLESPRKFIKTDNKTSAAGPPPRAGASVCVEVGPRVGSFVSITGDSRCSQAGSHWPEAADLCLRQGPVLLRGCLPASLSWPFLTSACPPQWPFSFWLLSLSHLTVGHPLLSWRPSVPTSSLFLLFPSPPSSLSLAP